MKYDKPHLTFEHQLDHLISRGMDCTDRGSAVAALQRLGYYRLSAYAYPFRELLPEDAQRDSSVQFRGDRFTSGTDFSVVTALSELDRDLRLLCLRGLQTIELALRVQVAYVLGARDTFGHLNIDSLDEAVAVLIPNEDRESIHAAWKHKHERAVLEAKSEDFVTHYVEKYDGLLPIWVATEVMDFGSLVRLFGMMKRTDQNSVARALGVPDGRLFYKWLKVLNYVRNVCAHHGRLWNRRLTYRSPSWPDSLMPQLSHIARISHSSQRKIYPVLTMIEYLANIIEDNNARWGVDLRQLIGTFPRNDTVSIHVDMGFPEEWPAFQQ